MDPILERIYSTVLGGAPYVVAAYVAMWVVLLVYVLMVSLSYKKTEKQIAALEEALLEKKGLEPDNHHQ